jgi:hypothetical protein
LGLNGPEWAKRQLEKKKIAYQALDSGFLSCAQPDKLQQICDSLGPEEIDRVFRKWLKRIPLPLRPQDREEISAISNHFRLPAMAFKITSCTFIIRSVPQRTLADWLLVPPSAWPAVTQAEQIIC